MKKRTRRFGDAEGARRGRCHGKPHCGLLGPASSHGDEGREQESLCAAGQRRMTIRGPAGWSAPILLPAGTHGPLDDREEGADRVQAEAREVQKRERLAARTGVGFAAYSPVLRATVMQWATLMGNVLIQKTSSCHDMPSSAPGHITARPRRSIPPILANWACRGPPAVSRPDGCPARPARALPGRGPCGPSSVMVSAGRRSAAASADALKWLGRPPSRHEPPVVRQASGARRRSRAVKTESDKPS